MATRKTVEKAAEPCEVVTPVSAGMEVNQSIAVAPSVEGMNYEEAYRVDHAEHVRLMEATKALRDKGLKLVEDIMESNGKPPYNEQQLNTLDTVMRMYHTFMV